MILSAITLLLAFQTPKTFEELELAKLIAFHAAKSLRMEVAVTVDSGKDVSDMHIATYIDGNRSHMVFSIPGQMSIEQIDDGTNSWFINHTAKTYNTFSDATIPAFDAKSLLLAVKPDSFSMNLIGLHPIQFASDPPPVLGNVETVHEGAVNLRKVVASTVSRKGRHLKITQWFRSDRWILARFEVAGESESGPTKVVAKATTLDFHPVIPDKEFFLDPAKVSGYKKDEGGSPPP